MLHAGFLALENMNYFAKKNRDFFSKVEIRPLARVDFGSLCLTPFLQFSFFFDSTFWSKTAGRTERIARLQPLLWRSPSFCWSTPVFRAMVCLFFCSFGSLSAFLTFSIHAADDHDSVLLGFEDLHTYALQSLFKLWVEMQASSSDMV